MHITVYCPHCQSRYQLDPSLRGKRMRCPNNLCRLVFEVREEGDSEGARPRVSPPLPAPPSELGILSEDAPASTPPSPEAIPEKKWDSQWEPPPIRRETPSTQRDDSPPISEPPAQVAVSLHPVARQSSARHQARLLIVAMMVVLVAVLGVGVYWVKGKGAANEEERFKKAQNLYQKQDFEAATTAFQKLLHDYPTSKNRSQYDFLVELSAVRDGVYGPRDQPDERAEAHKNLLQFLEINKNDPLLKEYHGDIWHTLHRLAGELTALAEQKQDPALLAAAKHSWAEASKFTPPAGAKVDDANRTLEAEFTRIGSLVAVHTARLELFESLRDLKAQGTAAAVRNGRDLAKKAGLDSDPEVVALLDQLTTAHRAKVNYTPALPGKTGDLTPRRPSVDADNFPSFYIAPRIGKTNPTPGGARTPTVAIALARGVLYALDAENGNLLWVRRVGVDTTLLPLRVPATVFMPEMVLVISSDTKSITAVNAATGAPLWQHGLGGICLGQPVLVERQLFVPTLNGDVEEIETTSGTWQGTYSLGQPLVLGGVRQPGTNLVFFPADSYSVYILDVGKRTCAGILYTGHAPGALRGLPVIWNEKEGAGWMLVDQASGRDSVELRAYALPIRGADQPPAVADIHVRGDAAASPWFESGRLALATDAGLLALFGVRLPGNRDPLLFRALSEDYRLESPERAHRGRPLIHYVEGNDFWVSAGGQLHRLEAGLSLKSGPALTARWPQPLEVGSPLHAGQVTTRTDGKKTLIFVTQDSDQPICRVRALAAEDGQILWQRQLGMVLTGPPVAAAEVVLCPDARGVALFTAGAADKTDSPVSWRPEDRYFANSARGSGQWSGASAKGFVHLTWGPGPIIRLQILDKNSIVSTRSFPVPAWPLGTPALGTDFVLLPLANGVVCRLPLGEGNITYGPDWRGIGVDEAQPGHIVALGSHDFALTDGGRRLTRFHWPDAKVWDKQASIDLPFRITSAPVVLGKRLLVADASNTVTILEGANLGAGQRWLLPGKITAGPFVRGGAAGVIVGKKRLVWLEPDKEQPAWEYGFVAPVVGQPECIDNMLVVADLQGNILGLDPRSGDPLGPGYRLKANEAPTATPLGFGTGQVFIPLMDGTAMVLPLAKLR